MSSFIGYYRAYTPRSFLINAESPDSGSTFSDKSPNAISAVGNGGTTVPARNTSTVQYGAASMYFAGPDGYREFSDHAALRLGTGDFTIQTWVYPLGGSTGLASRRSKTLNSPASWSLFSAHPGVSNYCVLAEIDGGAGTNRSLGTTLTASTWNHVAFCRQSGTLRGYKNGVKLLEVASSHDYGSTNEPLMIGCNTPANSPFFGYIDDFAISNFAEYGSSNFTPPGSLG